ncbi:MAG TPA: SRPBCC domain-containing protein [Microscillaceae bacterium]|nr:SRPBCC domain-containing protein [Microscillaceae bacterium]
MTNLNSTTSDGKAITIKKTFSRETAVSIEIGADQAVIWALLTNASDFSRWNSTIISIDGEIVQGEKIKLKATLDPKRTFKIKIKEVVPEKKMVWGDAMGNRVFTLTKQANNKVLFHMREKIGSPMFPLFASQIPPFDDAFEQYAADLKKEAESIAAN